VEGGGGRGTAYARRTRVSLTRARTYPASGGPLEYGVPLNSKSGVVSVIPASRAEAMSTAAKPIKPDVNPLIPANGLFSQAQLLSPPTCTKHMLVQPPAAYHCCLSSRVDMKQPQRTCICAIVGVTTCVFLTRRSWLNTFSPQLRAFIGCALTVPRLGLRS
jgi:hypothetical protein